MTISRYKIMAGILGVSLGGLAVAGQCSRPDTPHRSGDPAPADPKVPSAGGKTVPLPAVPPPPAVMPVSALPSPFTVDLPAYPVPSAAPTKLPDLPTVPPARVELPKPASLPTPVVIPASGTTLPDLPPALPPMPEKTTPKATPPAPPAPPLSIEPTAPTSALIPAPPAPSSVVVTTPLVPPTATPPSPSIDPAPPRPAQGVATPVPQQQAAAVANRFRILLRVGEGEPMFEVKSGDDLVLRVVCEKVDVKSPEKGQGPSSVVASGRVRFVGFGAEGTCDNLAFQAGSGEVSMTGAVRVQVKDRIGRVESELTSDRLQYRLDANALPGTLRP